MRGTQHERRTVAEISVWNDPFNVLRKTRRPGGAIVRHDDNRSVALGEFAAETNSRLQVTIVNHYRHKVHIYSIRCRAIDGLEDSLPTESPIAARDLSFANMSRQE